MRDIKQITAEINEVENWLRENPTGNWEHRYDMIVKLAKLQQELTQNQQENEV